MVLGEQVKDESVSALGDLTRYINNIDLEVKQFDLQSLSDSETEEQRNLKSRQ